MIPEAKRSLEIEQTSFEICEENKENMTTNIPQSTGAFVKEEKKRVVVNSKSEKKKVCFPKF